MRTPAARSPHNAAGPLCPAALSLVLAVSANAAAIYNFTSFDGPGNNGGGTTVNAIDNNGDVVGFSSDNAANPTLRTNFIRNAASTLTIQRIGEDPLAMANGVNDLLAVAGGFSNGTAFLRAGDALVALAGVNGTTAFQTAFGINDGGLMVGQYTDNATATTPGYLLQNAIYTILNPMPGALVTNAQAVNNNGLVAGFYSADGAHQHGFFYNSATAQFILAPDPSIPNLILTQFLGINDGGLAVGYYQLPDGSQHGFLYNLDTRSYTYDPNAAHRQLVQGVRGRRRV
jgi:hypothetical protein